MTGAPMWAYRLAAPRTLERVTVRSPGPADLEPGEVLLRLTVGGICGSDVGRFLHPAPPDAELLARPGHPLHEVAGVVLASHDERYGPGDRVVGYAAGLAGLRELVVTPAAMLTPVPAGIADLDAIVVQPLATVLFALHRLPPVDGREVAVVGLGPIGLLFCHALHDAGARVVGVDPVDRTELAKQYGIDEPVVAASADWAVDPAYRSRFHVTVEAVGHQTGTLTDAILATGQSGHVFSFGVPDAETYPLPMRETFAKNLTVYAGTTRSWDRFLAAAADYVDRHRDLVGGPHPYVTHALPVDEVPRAFALAATAAPDRRKVVIAAG